MNRGRPFRILAIDGGGLRGIFAAHLLQCIEQKLGVDLYDSFDMIAGTSTGSIIAAGIARKLPAARLVELYREQGHHIFAAKPKPWYLPRRFTPAVQALYDSGRLQELLEEVFQDVTLGDIKKPLLIPATDVAGGRAHVLKSGYSPGFTRDPHLTLSSAVLASCSAPGYFDPTRVDPYLLADGGIWANNPALAAYIDARTHLGVQHQDVRVLSLGTGTSAVAYGMAERPWGLLNGWRGIGFISFLLSLQARATHSYLQLMLEDHQLLRLDFETDLPLPMDDPSIMDDLVYRADQCFSYRTAELRAYFDGDLNGIATTD